MCKWLFLLVLFSACGEAPVEEENKPATPMITPDWDSGWNLASLECGYNAVRKPHAVTYWLSSTRMEATRIDYGSGCAGMEIAPIELEGETAYVEEGKGRVVCPEGDCDFADGTSCPGDIPFWGSRWRISVDGDVLTLKSWNCEGLWGRR